MTVKFDLAKALPGIKVPNGAILVVSIRYAGQNPSSDTRGRTSPKTYDYAMMKAGGLWYVTGAGRSPQAATWTAVERWLEKDGREVVRVEIVTGIQRIWPPDVVEAEAEDPPYYALPSR